MFLSPLSCFLFRVGFWSLVPPPLARSPPSRCLVSSLASPPSILLIPVPLPSCHFSLPASHPSRLFFPPLLPSGLPQSPRRKSGLWCWTRSWSIWKTVKTTVRSKPFSCELAPRGYVAPGPWGLGTAAPASALPPCGLGRGGGEHRFWGAGGSAGAPTLPQPKFRGDSVPGDMFQQSPRVRSVPGTQGPGDGQDSATLGSLSWPHQDLEAARTNRVPPSLAVRCSQTGDRAPPCWSGG